MITGHKTKSRLVVYLPVGIIVSVSLILAALFCFIKWKRRNHAGTNANAGGGANGEINVRGNASVVGNGNELGVVKYFQKIINNNY